MSFSLWKSLPFGLLSAAALLIPSDCVYSKPTGPTLKKGEAVITLGAGGEAMLIQAGKSALIDWQEFSIAREEILRIIHAGGSGCLVNRVTGTEKSELLGKLLSNGSVYLINPNGILIGKDAYIDTAGFIASTLDLLNEDLSEKTLHFQGDSEAEVINEGTIHCKVGDVFLIGRKVENAGEIVTENGRQGFLSGFDVVVRPNDAPKVQIRSEQVLEREEFAKNPYALAIRHSGKSLTGEKQGVYVSAANGKCEVSGEIVSPEGTVHVLGDVVHFTDEAVIDVSGENGGDVRMGGDYQGSGDLKRAKRVRLEKEGRISANALAKGDGGKVILWSDGLTEFFGEIEAEGGKEGGDGGFVEVSGKNLAYRGRASTIAPHGKGGTLLLDPFDVIIGTTTSGASDTGCTGGTDTWTPTASGGVIGTTDLVTSLNSCNVIVQSGAAGSDTGNITVQSSFAWSSGNSLTLNASNSILIATSTTIAGNGMITLNAGGGNLDGISVFGVLNSSSTIVLNGVSSVGDGIDVDSGAQIISSGGNISLNGSSSSNTGVSIGSCNITAAGAISIVGTSSLVATSSIGILIGTANLNSSSTIVMNGISSGGTGIDLSNTNLVNSSNSGIFLTGTTNGTVNQAQGIQIQILGTMSAAGTIMLNGYSAGQTGVFMLDVNQMSAGNGIFLNGTSNGTLTSSYGVYFGTSTITNLASPIVMNGYGNGGPGVALDTTSQVISSSGSISLNGTSTSSYGVYFGASAAMTAVGPIVMNGYSTSNAGIVLLSSDQVTSSSGSISLNGSATAGYGVYVGPSGTVNAAGSISVIGTSGITGVSSTAGVYVDGVLNGSMVIAIDGYSSSTGILLDIAGQMICSGGNLSLYGTSTLNGDGVTLNAGSVLSSSALLTVSGYFGTISGTNNGITANGSLSASEIVLSGNTLGTTTASGINISGGAELTASSAILLTGTSGANNSSAAGVVIGTSTISATGSGSVSVMGAMLGTSTARGVSFNAGSLLLTDSGSIFIFGLGPNSQTAVAVAITGGQITSTTGSIILSGTLGSAAVFIGATFSSGTSGTVVFQNCFGIAAGVTISGTFSTNGPVVFTNCSGPTNAGVNISGNMSIGGALIATQGITGQSGWVQTRPVTASGNINISATSVLTGGSGEVGISITSSIISSGGSIVLIGSYTGPAAGPIVGVRISGGQGALSAAGSIIITGITSTPGANSYGVQITAPTTMTGSVQFLNCQGGAGAASHGVYLDGTIFSTTGSISFNNCTAGNNSGGFGVDIAGTVNATGNLLFASITTGSLTVSGGAVEVISTITVGGALVATQGITTGAGTNNTGWLSSASISASSIDILASSGSTIGTAYGISITGGTLTTTAGSLILQGISGTTSTVSYGINLGGATFSITGGNLQLSGTSNASANLSHGVAFTAPFSINAPVLFSNSSGGTGGSCSAIYIGSTFIGSSTVTFATLTTAAGATNSAPVWIDTTGSVNIGGALIATQSIVAAAGTSNVGFLSGGFIQAASISITASSAATTGTPYGISITAGTLNAGAIILNGSAVAAGTSGGIKINSGVYLTASGPILLTGTSSSAADNSQSGGVVIGTSTISATGSGSISMMGFNSNVSEGIECNGASLSTGSGSIFLFGMSTNYGIGMSNTQITSTTGSIILSGTGNNGGVGIGTLSVTTGGTLIFQNSFGPTAINIADLSTNCPVVFTNCVGNLTAVLIGGTTSIGGALIATQGITGTIIAWQQQGAITASGDIQISATALTTTGAGRGIFITAPLTSSSGSIVLIGSCTGTSSGSSMGVAILNATGTLLANGAIVITGSTNSTGANSYGVEITAPQTAMTGPVQFINCQGGAGSASHGVYLDGTAFSTAGSISFNNCTAGNNSGGFGVNISGTLNATGNLIFASITTGALTSGGGAVEVIATMTVGGALVATQGLTTGAGTNNTGWLSSASISASSIDILASSGSTIGTAYGISITGGTLTTIAGSLILQGISGTTSTVSYGINLGGGTFSITGGNLQLSGTSNASANLSHGVAITAPFSINVPILFSNSSGGTGGSCSAIYIGSTLIGSSTLTFATLTTAVGAVNSAPVWIDTTGSVNMGGALVATESIVAAAGAGNLGFLSGGFIQAASIDIEASSLATTGAANGISIVGGTMTTTAGSLILQGVSGTSIATSYGINLGGATFSVTGGSFVLSGTSNANGASSHGVMIATSFFSQSPVLFTQCQGGTGSGSAGVSIGAPFAASNTVTFATITTAGTNGAGILITSSVTISGNLVATQGITTGAGSGNVGWRQTGGSISINGGASITASSLSTTGAAHGISMTGGTLNAVLIAISGTGGASSSPSNGVNIAGGTITTSTGSITISGSASGTATSYGFSLSSGSVQSSSGSITITGTSTATGTGSSGVFSSGLWNALTTGTVTFNGSISASGLFPIQVGATFSTGGVLLYNDAVGIGGTITSVGITSNGTMTFASTLDGFAANADSLTLSASNTAPILFDGNIGATTPLASLVVGTATSAQLSSSVGTVSANTMNFAVPVTYATTGTLNLIGTAGITFGSTLDAPGAGNLQVTAGTATAQFNGDIGLINPLGVMLISTAGAAGFGTLTATVNVAALDIVSPIPATFAISGSATVTASGTGGIIFGGDLNPAASNVTTLNLNAATGSVTFGGNIGNSAIFEALNINEASAVVFTAGTHTANVNTWDIGTMSASIPTLLQGAGTTTINSGGAITFFGTIDGSQTLTLNATSTVALNSNIGETTPLASLIVGTATSTTLGSNVGTINANTMNFASPVTYATTGTLNLTGTNGITFGSTLDAPDTGSLQLSGTVAFGGNIGSTNPLGTVTVLTGASFGTQIATVNVAALNLVAPAPATFAATTTTVTASNSITFGGDLNPAVNNVTTLDLNAATGSVTFGGDIGNNNIFAALNINEASTVVFSTGTHTANVNNWVIGSSSMLIPTVLQGTDSTTINSSGVITFDGTIDGSQTLNLNATSTVTLGGDVGVTTPLNTLAIIGGSELLFGTSVATVTVGTLNISGTIPTVFSAATTTVTTTGSGGITFNGSLNSEADNVTTLNLSAVGPVTFGNDIGTSAIFEALNINAASQVVFTAAIHTVDVHTWDIGATATLIPTLLQGAGTTTINSGGSITFYGTIDGSQTLTLNATSTVNLNGNIGATTALTALDIPEGSLTAFGASVATVTATVVNIASPVTYATTGTLNITGSTTFGSTLNAPGTGNLQLSGTVSFGGNIGSTNPLGNLTVLTAASFGTQTATVNVAALNLIAPAPATFAATTTIVTASNSITFGGDLNAAVNNVTTLDLNAATGSVTFGGNIGNNEIFAALNINEASAVVFTAGTHTANVNSWVIGSSSMLIPTVLQGTDSTTINSGGAITFFGTIDGSQTLTLNATSTVALNSNIGETTPLASLIVGTATSTTLGSNVGTINANTMNFASPVTYATTGTLNLTGTNGITFGSTLDATGTGDLQLFGTVAFGGDIGSTNPLGTVTVLTGASFGTQTATVNVAALNLMAPAPATFAATTTTVTASNSITFGGDLNAAANNVTTLDLNAATGSVTFGGDIGNNNIFAALNINEASTVVFTTGTHTANVNNWVIGSSSMLIPTVLQGTDSTTINSSGVITFDGTIDGSQTLNLNATSTVTLGGDIGFTTPLNTLAIIGGSQLLFGTSVATVTVGTLNISGTIPTVFSAATTTVTTTGSGGITFNGSLNGAVDNVTTLNLDAVGPVTFGNDIGTSAIFEALNINAASEVVFTAGTHTVDVHSWDIGTLTTLIPTVLQGTDSTTINSGGSITFYGTIDGSQTLTLNATDTVNLNGNIGATTPLTALDIPVGSQANFGSGADTVAASTVSVSIAAAFATSTVMTATNGITFGSTLDGSANLTLNAASGTLSFGANITTIGETTLNAGTASFGASVATVNVSALNVEGTTHSLFAAATTTVTGSSGDVTFSGDIDGTANGVTTLNLLSPNGSVTIGGNVGVLFRLKALNINATMSMLNAGSTTVFTSGTHSVNVGAFNSASPVVAEGVGSTTINTDFSSGPITFGDTINGDGGGSYTIVLNAGTGGLGTITLNGNVGDTDPLGTFSVVSADLTTMASTVGTLSAGEISLSSPVTYATTGTLNITGSTTFGSTLDAPGTGALQLSGTVSFGGNIGSTNPLGTLTVLTAASFGASTATVNVAALNLVAPAPATFAATTANVNASNSITFGGDLNPAANNVTTLNLNAATGSVTFGGDIGNNDIFAALNINEASAVVFSTGTHTANVNNWIIGSSSMLIPTVLEGTDSTTINSGGVITFFGTIDGSQTLNLNATSTITLDSDIGATTPLNTLAIEAGSELLFGDAVTTVTVGTLNISGTIPTVFSAIMTTVTTTGSGGITFNGSLNGEADNVTTLNLDAVGPVTFGNDIGTTEMFTALNINAASQVIFTAGTHTVDVHSWDIGTITTLIPTLLQGAGTTTINSSGSITFYGTIDGSQTLTLNATDTVNLNGNIGATTALTALDIPEGSLTAFGTLTATVTATVVNIASPVTYATTGTLNITGSTTFASTLDAPGTGDLQLSGTVFFGGNIGSTNPLGTLTVLTAASFGTQTATINVAGLNIVAPAPATFSATITTVTASNNITFGGDLNAAVNNVTTLNLNAATGSVTFGGNIGNNAIFAALNINEASTVVFATGTHTVDVNNWIVGSSTMLIPTILQGTNATTINSGGSITFYGTVDGAQSLTLNATNAVTLNSNVGATTPLAALNIPVGSQAIFGTAAGTVNASIVNIAIPAAFATSTVVTGTNGITFGSTLDGSANLTLNAVNGTLSFGANVTTVGETILNAGTASFGAAVTAVSVGALNVQTTTHAIFAAATTTVTATSGDLTFSGNIDGTANGVTTLNLLAPNGTVTIGDNVGTLFRLNALNINAGSTTVFTSGTHSVNVGSFDSVSPVIAEGVGSTTINTDFPSGPITFGDTINSDGGGSYTIVLNAGTGGLGTITLNGNVGDTNPLGTFSVVSGDLTTMASTVGTISAGAISFASPVTYATTATLNMIGTNGITFGSTLDAPGTGNLALSAASGSIFFNGNVGVSNAPGNVLVSTANLTSFGTQTSIVNIGALTIMSPTTFGVSATVTASAGGISFDGILNANTSATLNFSALQTVSFNGNVGLTSKPAGINVTTASQVSFGTQTATVNVGALTIADAIPAQFTSSGTTSVTTGGGPISFGGTVDGPASINLVAGTGTITFNGDIGNITPPAALQVTSAALTSFTSNASSVIAGRINISSPAQIAAATTTMNTSAANGNISFGSTINGIASGAQSLTLTAGTGAVTFGGAIGTASLPLGTITTISAGTVSIGNPVVATGATFTHSGTLAIAAAGSMTLTNSFFETGGAVQTAGNISAGDNIHFTDPITLTGNVAMTATNDINYDSTIDGNAALTSTGANVTYSGAVGASTALTSITTTVTGVITINANQTVSSGPMTYTGDVSLTNNAIFTDNGSGAVSFSADITGAHNATITAPNTSVSAGGNIDLSGSVGGNLDISAGSGFTIVGSITTTGVSTGGSVAISSSNGSVQVNTVTTTGGTSSGNITLSASSAISGGYPVGLIVLDGNLDASPASAQGGIITLDSNRPSEPTVATIVGSSYPPGNSITIEGQSIVMGYNEAMTIYGDITLLAPSMTLSDIVALDNLTIDAGGGTIYANTRGTVTILNSSGMMVFSPTLHYLAGGSYSRTGNLELVDPSEPAPVEESVPLLTYDLLIYNGHVLNYDPNEMPVPPTPPSPVTPTSKAAYEMYLLAIANSQLSDRLPIYWHNFPPPYYLRQKLHRKPKE